MKKTISYLLSVFLFFSLFSFSVFSEESDPIVVCENDYLDYSIYSNPSRIEYRINLPASSFISASVNGIPLSDSYYFISDHVTYYYLFLEGYYVPNNDFVLYHENDNSIEIIYQIDDKQFVYNDSFTLKNTDFSPSCYISANRWSSENGDIVFTTNGPLNTMRMIMNGPDGSVITSTERDIFKLFTFDYVNGTVTIPSGFLEGLGYGSYSLTIQWAGYFEHYNIQIVEKGAVIVPEYDYIDMKASAPPWISYNLYLAPSDIINVYINDKLATENDYSLNAYEGYLHLVLWSTGRGCREPKYEDGLNTIKIEYNEGDELKTYESTFTVANADFEPHCSLSSAKWYPGAGTITFLTDGPMKTMRFSIRKTVDWKKIFDGDITQIAENEHFVINQKDGSIIIGESLLETLEEGEYDIRAEWAWGQLDLELQVLSEDKDFVVLNDNIDYSDPYWGGHSLEESRISINYLGKKEDIKQVKINNQEVQYYAWDQNEYTYIYLVMYNVDREIVNDTANELTVIYNKNGGEEEYTIPIYLQNIDFDPNVYISADKWHIGQEDIYLNVEAPLDNTGFRLHCYNESGKEIINVQKNGKGGNLGEAITLDEDNHKIMIHGAFFTKNPAIKRCTFEISWKGYYFNSPIEIVSSISALGGTLTLDENIGVGFIVNIPEELNNDSTKLVITHKGERHVFSANDPDFSLSGYPVFSWYIPIKELSDTLVLTAEDENGNEIPLVNSKGVPYTEGYEYSGVKYRDRAMSQAEPDLKLLALLDAMFNFSNTSRIQFNYKADTAQVDTDALEGIDANTVAAYEIQRGGTYPQGAKFSGRTLVLESATIIRHYLTINEDADWSSFVVKAGYGDDEANYKEATLTRDDQYPQYYKVDIAAVAKYLDRDYTVKLESTAGDESYYITFSGLSYAYNVLSKDNPDPTLSNVVKAMYVYNQKAKEFFAENY